LCVKEILAQDIGFAEGLFSGDSGDFRVRGGEGELSTIGRGSSGCFWGSSGHTDSSRPVFRRGGRCSKTSKLYRRTGRSCRACL